MHSKDFIQKNLRRGIGGSHDDLATQCAHDAKNTFFHSRRGVFQVFIDAEEPLLCIYNNNPYSDDDHRRDREIVVLYQQLELADMQVVGHSVSPAIGEEDGGYTYAILVEVGEDEWSNVISILERNLENNKYPEAQIDTQDTKYVSRFSGPAANLELN